MIVQICIGSSCHIKGSAKIVEKMKNAIELYGLENEITLAGSFRLYGELQPKRRYYSGGRRNGNRRDAGDFYRVF